MGAIMGKRTCYYEEALRAVKQAIAPVEPVAVMSDFEKAELKSFELVFPLLFSDVLSLAYIPPEEVRRAFALLVERAPIGCQPFLGYVARIFIGLTAHELDEGVDIAFAPRIDDSRDSSILSDHDYIQRVQHQQANVVPRWEHPIIRAPQFKIGFWNVNHRALASIEKTNNAMEASHQQMARELNHHPALSDLLFALKSDIDKQCDIARAARSFNHVRRKQYVIRENRLMTTLARAEYVTNEDLLNVLTLIGLQIQGYVAGIRVRNLENAREEESTAEALELSEENTGNDSQIYIV
uniref:Uncharacterized protein n=1 Tax=Globodera rostochiensis TaxID=31243 RepID=A0A914HI23_GLORO